MTSAPPPVGDAALTKRLAALLSDAGFNAERIRDVLRNEGDTLAKPRDVPVQLRRLEHAPQPLATLVALFVLDVSLDAADTKRRLGASGDELLRDLRLVEQDGVSLRSAARLIPHDHLIIASDRARGDAGPDHVAGVHRPSAGLAHLTIRRTVSRALDVGTGNGIQALLCAEHSESVIGTDVNDRALEFARFNALLNGVKNVEFRAGSFFAPVAGERFDLVVSNPPYVITPDSDFLFRDGGMESDQVSELVTRELPTVLEEGGYATMTASWVQSGADPVSRPREWLQGSGCDAWVVHTSTEDPVATAAAWNQDTPIDELDQRLDRWLGYYAERKIEAVSYGAFVLRKRAGTNWIRSCAVPRSGINRAGSHLERLFAMQDLLVASSDAELLGGRFRLHEDVRLEHSLRAGEDGWSLAQAELVLTDGLPFRAGLDEATSAIVRALAPPRPLADVLTAAADQLGIDAGRFRPAGVEFVKQLLELGYVLPA